MHEEEAVLSQRAAMNFHDGRIFLGGIKAGWFENPALEIITCPTFKPDLFNLAQINLGQPVLVEIGQQLRRAVSHGPAAEFGRGYPG